MANSISPKTVENRRELLKDLEAGKTTRWTTAVDPLATRRLANQIREALFVARKFPEQFPALAQAAERFSIHIVTDGLIEARVKPTKTETSASSSVPTHGGETLGTERTSLVGLGSAAQVINSWKAHLPSSDALHFTRTQLSQGELRELYKWTRTWKPKLMILVGDDTLTLSLWDVTIKEFAWHPPRVSEPEEKFDV